MLDPGALSPAPWSTSLMARPPSDPHPGPISGTQRIGLLDVLRGFALLGILLANIEVFAGLIFQLPETRTWTGADRMAAFVVDVLVHEKFYSIFSLLFGIGFSIIMRRTLERGAAFAPLFRRRLWLLLGIGLVHAILIWAGDILVLYAVLGFVLLLFRERSQRTILAWCAALLASPVLVYFLFLVAGMPDPFTSPPRVVEGPDIAEMIFGAFRSGGYDDVVAANALMYAGGWIRYFIFIRIPKVLGMFLLGLWLDRRGLLRDVAAHRGLLRRVVLIGLLVGIPANTAVAYLNMRGAYLPFSPLGLVQTALAVVGVPALALGYVAAIALLFQRPETRRVLLVLAPAGRMALTTYLSQSVLGVVLFYGIGFGLWQRLAPMTVYGIAFAIYAAQLVVSRLWMKRFAYGPVEWLWRRLTYRRSLALALPRASVAASSSD
jgi:uncharacterized protein